MISGQNMLSGSLPIESGRAQGCIFFWENGNLEFWKLSGGIWACSRQLFFSGKMAISDSGSKFLDSGSPPIESGHAQGCLFFWKMAIWDSEANFGILEVTHRWIWIWIYPICDSMQYPDNKGEGWASMSSHECIHLFARSCSTLFISWELPDSFISVP